MSGPPTNCCSIASRQHSWLNCGKASTCSRVGMSSITGVEGHYLNGRLRGFPDAQAFAFAPPVIPGIGTSGGVTFMLEDRAGRDPAFLAANTATFLAAARQRPEFALLFTTLLPSVPQLFAEVDRDKVLKQGINLASVYQTLQAFMGSTFVNYFNQFGRVWQVYVQAEGAYRT